MSLAKSVGRDALRWVLLAAVYVVAAEIGFSLAFSIKQVTAVWPPTGFAVAALLIWGFRVWPGIWLGAFVSNVLTGEPVWTAAAIAIGNTAGPVVTAALLRAARFDNALERIRDVVALLVATPLAMTIAATNGVAQLALAHIVPWQQFSGVWLTWLAGDTIGVLIVAPLLLTLSKPSAAPTQARPREYAGLVVLLFGIAWLTFVSSATIRLSVYPFLIWVALRFGQRQTAWAIATVAIVAIWGTAHQLGELGVGTLDQRLVSLDSFLALFGGTGMLLAAATVERRVATDRLRTAAQTLQTAFLPAVLPQRIGMQSDGLYLAAGKEALVGGDWYDGFELRDGSVVISIGDVTGHGLDAAVTASKMRQAIFASAFDSSDPADLLERANASLHAQDAGMASAIVAIFDPDLRSMRFASAGHVPPMVETPSMQLTLPVDGGCLLGTFDTVHAKTRVVEIAPGYTIVFYTDGLVEFARNVAAAEEKLRRALEDLRTDPSIAHPAAFLQARVMGTARPVDDVAIVVVAIS